MSATKRSRDACGTDPLTLPSRCDGPLPLPQGERGQAAIQELIARGMSDTEIGARFGKSKNWAYYIRRKYGLAPALNQGMRPCESPAAFGYVAGARKRLALRDARFFGTNGRYPSFTEREIAAMERVHAMGLAPARRNVTAAVLGDPPRGRSAASP